MRILSVRATLTLFFLMGGSDAFHSYSRRPRSLIHFSEVSKKVAPTLKSRSLRALYSTEDDDTESRMKIKISKGYKIGQLLFGFLGVIVLLMPDRTGSIQLASKFGGAAGYLIAAGLCYILEGANDNGRLTSDTYKRLNVGLLGFSLFGLVAVPGEAAFFYTAPPAIILAFGITLIRIYGSAISYVGWKRGVLPSESLSTLAPVRMTKELSFGIASNVPGLRVESPKKALTYRNCYLLVIFGAFSRFMQGLFSVRYSKALSRGAFDVSIEWSGAARLFMISTMIYSLKDAAERDRLSGTTFIQLNLMVGIWATLVGLGQSICFFGFELSRGVEMFAIAMTFLLKAFKSQKEKDERKKLLQ